MIDLQLRVARLQKDIFRDLKCIKNSMEYKNHIITGTIFLFWAWVNIKNTEWIVMIETVL